MPIDTVSSFFSPNETDMYVPMAADQFARNNTGSQGLRARIAEEINGDPTARKRLGSNRYTGEALELVSFDPRRVTAQGSFMDGDMIPAIVGGYVVSKTNFDNDNAAAELSVMSPSGVPVKAAAWPWMYANGPKASYHGVNSQIHTAFAAALEEGRKISVRIGVNSTIIALAARRGQVHNLELLTVNEVYDFKTGEKLFDVNDHTPVMDDRDNPPERGMNSRTVHGRIDLAARPAYQHASLLREMAETTGYVSTRVHAMDHVDQMDLEAEALGFVTAG